MIDPSLLQDSAIRMPRLASPTGIPYTAAETGARYVLKVNATQIEVEGLCDTSPLVPGGTNCIGVMIDGVPQGTGVQMTALGVPTSGVFALAAGEHTVELLYGPSELNGAVPNGTPPWSCPVTRYRVPAGGMAIPQGQDPNGPQLVLVGDSTSAGFTSNGGAGAYDAWAEIARRNLRGSVAGLYGGATITINAVGGYRWTDFGATAQLVTDHVALVTRQLYRTGNKALLYWLGANDYLQGASVATVVASANAVVAGVHAAFPSLPIIFITPIQMINEGVPNGGGATLPAIRTGLAGIVTANPTFMTLLSGATMVTFPGNYAVDGIHPLPAGEIQQEAAVRVFLGY